jgi:hypothetical protein
MFFVLLEAGVPSSKGLTEGTPQNLSIYFRLKRNRIHKSLLLELDEFTMVSQPIRLILVDWFVLLFFLGCFPFIFLGRLSFFLGLSSIYFLGRLPFIFGRLPFFFWGHLLFFQVVIVVFSTKKLGCPPFLIIFELVFHFLLRSSHLLGQNKVAYRKSAS